MTTHEQVEGAVRRTGGPNQGTLKVLDDLGSGEIPNELEIAGSPK